MNFGSKGNEIIKFNCGGSKFEITRATIEMYPDTLLANMIKGVFSIDKDQQGYIFIDRDPHIFNDILNYYRYSYIPSCLTFLQRRDFEYFGITKPRPSIKIEIGEKNVFI